MSAELPEKLLVWDVESSGVDVENDRILTCYMMLQNRDGSIEEDWSWTIDPGIEIPKGASDVHGMTTDWVKENGRKDAKNAIHEIYGILGNAEINGVPIVAFNQRFDLSILHHELRRHGFEWGAQELADRAVFYDPFVHDRLRGDKYRKGKRRLVDLCGVYGIEFNEAEAHDARYDVLKTGDLAWKLLAKERTLGARELMPLLAQCKAEHDESLGEYFWNSGKRTESGEKILLDRGWPLITKKGN